MAQIRNPGHDRHRDLIPRDDRVLASTRWLAIFILPFLVSTFVVLYFLPTQTDRLFAWTIRPTLTAMIMASGYLGGAYFFAQVLVSPYWHRVHLGFPPVAAFTIFEGIATLLHLDRFNHQHVVFYVWCGLYLVTPILVPLVWFRNRRYDPGTPEPNDPLLPVAVRCLALIVGVFQLGVGLCLLLTPTVLIGHWPWLLTPLTAGVIGGWFALPGVVALMLALDPRWSACRFVLQSQLIGLALILIATVRAWSELDHANPLSGVFVAGIAGLFLAVLALYCVMELRRRVSRRIALAGAP